MNDATDKIPHRGRELLEVLARLGGSARNAQIAQVMGVSEETVRRLVKGLAEAGKVQRVHGGTYLSVEQDAPMYSGALEQNAAEKSQVARTALSLIDDGMTLFVNVGSTTTYVAEQLRERANLTVVTNSISVVGALAEHNGTRVFLTGGEVMRAERGCFGRRAELLVRQFAYDAAIFGCDAVCADMGVLIANPAEAELTRTAVEHAQNGIVVTDSGKFNRRAACVACDPEQISDLVTEAAPDAALQDALQGWGIRTHVADPAAAAIKDVDLPS
ncbi:DeoR/GlpR family DNA-binding transcription regulator [Epibacterium ulvae]|uniref:DeoR/GlpR family DNA-binding transcription regulator n=1 Tax=Epibacterium ulvae TaxID=1156985 RepID=UPI001BFC5235|nr:DeoR/GlpR family DNA-binding transcription regulator [Epibacterium ulvae]MBT8155045.1 DeoR/GlpR family DNA-binding transcription regulator [Epibacterium ulvae]